MSEKTKQLKKMLFNDKQNGIDFMSADELAVCDEFCEGYKEFLGSCKTEREVAAWVDNLAVNNGYVKFDAFGETLNPGDRVYINNRGKSVILCVKGKRSIKDGVRIAAAHIDSPRMDLKQCPVYENEGLAYFKTHYYGGVKKYQWTAIPLSLHGRICKNDGTFVDVRIGEEAGEPKFCITDILPHLGGEQMSGKAASIITGEQLNVLIGGLPYEDEDVSDKIKLNVLDILNKQYGMNEEDFLSAELSAVPAFPAKDVGFDRALIASYGHDDRVCAYPALRAVLDMESEHTVLAMLVDKEEIGSEGTTGMQCKVYEDLMEEIAIALKANFRKARFASKCLSSDVTAAYDPNFASVYEKNNSALVSYGTALCKFTGARGKSGSSDASAEFVGEVRAAFDKEGVVWQTAELGKVDAGGGGTVAKFIANMNIDTVDLGVPVISMHAPYEVVSKADVYSNYKAFLAFMK